MFPRSQTSKLPLSVYSMHVVLLVIKLIIPTNILSHNDHYFKHS